MAGGKASITKCNIADRRTRALQIRKQGATYRKIAEIMRKYPDISPKYSEERAHSDVIAELRRIMDENKELAEEIVQLECERMDALLAAVWNAAMKGDPASVQQALKIMDRRADLLGLDKPSKRELTGRDGGPIEIIKVYKDVDLDKV